MCAKNYIISLVHLLGWFCQRCIYNLYLALSNVVKAYLVHSITLQFYDTLCEEDLIVFSFNQQFLVNVVYLRIATRLNNTATTYAIYIHKANFPFFNTSCKSVINGFPLNCFVCVYIESVHQFKNSVKLYSKKLPLGLVTDNDVTVSLFYILFI